MSLDKAKAMRELSPSYELAGASRGQKRFTTRLLYGRLDSPCPAERCGQPPEGWLQDGV
jgi:hypothetical protein